MKRLLLCAVVALLTAGCGIRPSDVIHGVEAPKEELDGVVLFFLNAGTLTRVVRPSAEPFEHELTLLAEGPTQREQREGLTTEIPPAAAPITQTADAMTVTVSISSPVAELSENAKDQLTCTAVPPWQEPQVQVVIAGPDQSTPVDACPFAA